MKPVLFSRLDVNQLIGSGRLFNVTGTSKTYPVVAEQVYLYRWLDRTFGVCIAAPTGVEVDFDKSRWFSSLVSVGTCYVGFGSGILPVGTWHYLVLDVPLEVDVSANITMQL